MDMTSHNMYVFQSTEDIARLWERSEAVDYVGEVRHEEDTVDSQVDNFADDTLGNDAQAQNNSVVHSLKNESLDEAGPLPATAVEEKKD